MNKRSITAIILLLTAPLGLKAQPADGAVREREEYAVYSALISQKFVTTETRLMVITDPTCCQDDDLDTWRLKQLEPFSPETLQNFTEANKHTRHFEKLFTLSVPYRIVDYKDITDLFSSMLLAEAWKKFYGLYPQSNGYLRFSRVGFNKDLTEALVDTGWMRGALEGEGKWFLLSRVDGKWSVQRFVGTWIS